MKSNFGIYKVNVSGNMSVAGINNEDAKENAICLIKNMANDKKVWVADYKIYAEALTEDGVMTEQDKRFKFYTIHINVDMLIAESNNENAKETAGALFKNLVGETDWIVEADLTVSNQRKEI